MKTPHQPCHLLSLKDLSGKEILSLVDLALKIKKSQSKYAKALAGKNLLMFFEKPSLRTRLSFEVAMLQLGGHAIYYDLQGSPLGKGKESVEDTARVVARYMDAIMARLYSHEDLKKIAANSRVPVINGLTDFSHPCQILSDLLTIREKFGKLKGLKLSYLGDANNNVTHSFMFALPKIGMHLSICCPPGKEFSPNPSVAEVARKYAKDNGTKFIISSNPEEVRDSDVLYTDSWMSYHIPKDQEARRISALQKYQVNSRLMHLAGKKAVFMHCLPAERGKEVTADVLDGGQSIVLDQAENRLHMQKAILVWLMK